MFFLVAGYFSKPFTTLDEVRFYVKKYARRLLPAYAFTQVIIILWAVLMAVVKKESWDPVLQQSLSLFWADPHGPTTPWGQLTIGVIWFLVALFFAKCALLFLSKLKVYAIPISILLALGAVLFHKIFPYSIWCISVGLTALPFVTLGWWFRTHSIPIWFITICIVCWVAAILYSHLTMYELEWGFFPLDFLGACGGSFCLYFLSRFISAKIHPLNSILALLGVWSLAIMCFHNLEMSCHLGNHLMALSPVALPLWCKFVFRYFVTIALAAIAYYTPAIRRIFS